MGGDGTSQKRGGEYQFIGIMDRIYKHITFIINYIFC